jgi:Ca2+-binding EF-hand superfamily protein
VKAELYSVVYDWFERENRSQYKLELTKEQYDQMKCLVSPIGQFLSVSWISHSLYIIDAHGGPLTFDQFCDILIPVLTGTESDHQDDYAIWLAFHSFDKNNDYYIQIDELESLMQIIGKSVSRERIRFLIDRVDWDQNGQLDYHEFRQFIIRGYARELLMMDITREIVYSTDRLEIPKGTSMS